MASILPHPGGAASPPASAHSGPFGAVPAMRPRAHAVRAPKRITGVLAFVALLVICLLNLNALGAMAFGMQRLLSYGMLVLCVYILLIYQLNLKQALGRAGLAFFAFLGIFLMIAGTMNLSTDADALTARREEFRLLLSSALIIAACALAVYSISKSYSPQTALRLVGIVALLIPATLYLGAAFPGIYRFREASIQGRFTGFYGNPNEAGTALCAALAIGFACMVAEKRRLFVMIALALTALAMLATFSRGAFLSMLVLTLSQIVISPVMRRKSIFIAIGVLTVGASLLIFKSASDSQWDMTRDQRVRVHTMAALLKGDISAETTGGRLQLAMNGVRHWMASPIFGHGIGGQRRVTTKQSDASGAHNTFIRTLGEGGAIAGIGLVAFFWIFFREGLRCANPYVKTAALSYLVVMFMACMTSHGVLAQRHHNAMLGVCFGMLAVSREMDTAARRRKLNPQLAS